VNGRERGKGEGTREREHKVCVNSAAPLRSVCWASILPLSDLCHGETQKEGEAVNRRGQGMKGKK
jgi:hypothetical protein